MREPDDLPRLPENRLEPSPRKLAEVKPGEQVILSVISNIAVDEDGHVWVDISSEALPIPLSSGLSLRAQRTEKGFILWLDHEVKFRRRPLYKHKTYLPVVEFRDRERTD